MKKIYSVMIAIVISIGMIGIAGAQLVTGIDTITIGGDTQGLNGQTKSITVDVSGMSGVGALKLDIMYNPSVITANTVTFGSVITGQTLADSNINNPSGKITIGIINASGLSGTGNLATISFTVLGNAPDSTTVQIIKKNLIDFNILPVTTEPTITNGTFTVIGLTPCTITAPADNTAEATGPTTIVNLGTPITSNCGSSVVTNDAPAGGFHVGITTVIWNVTGTSATDTQIITITDNTAPVISIIGDNPATIQVGNAYSDAGATAVDLVDGSVPVLTSGSVDTTTVGLYAITYNATDSAGNKATATRTVNVVSSPPPPQCTIKAPEDITKEATGLKTIVSLGTPETSNCGTSTVMNDAPIGGFPVGTTTVTWNVTGTSAIDTQLVTITPQQQPAQLSIDAPVNIKKSATGTFTTIANLGTPTVSGGTPPYNTVNDAPAGGFPVGNTTVTWTVTDSIDGTASDTQLVTINEAQITPPPPVPELSPMILTTAGIFGLLFLIGRNRR